MPRFKGVTVFRFRLLNLFVDHLLLRLDCRLLLFVFHKGRANKRQIVVHLVRIVEKGEEAIVVALRNRVVFVVMATSARKGEPEPNRADGFGPVKQGSIAELLLIRTAFRISQEFAVKGSGKSLIARGRSPAICSIANSSMGMSAFTALRTQFR